ncbi:MAG: putative PEP-binding protein, partial [Bacteroidota bacterium]
HLANRYDTLSPVMLRAMAHIVGKARQYQVEVGFCGDMARRPLEALALMAVGVRSFSVPASALGPLKAMIRSTVLRPVAEVVPYLVETCDTTIRHQLAAYARDHGIVV